MFKFCVTEILCLSEPFNAGMNFSMDARKNLMNLWILSRDAILRNGLKNRHLKIALGLD